MRGFSLIEIIIVSGIIATMALVADRSVSLVRETHNLRLSAQLVTQAVRQAQQYSTYRVGNEPWGVYIQNATATVFQGTTYASRNTLYDNVIPLSTGVSSADTYEVVFEEYTGIPTTAAVIYVTSAYATSTISISTSGVVEW